jgi:hypothetical protein
MHHFEDTGILTGYIKQLLASFNLPTPRIYLPEQEEFYREHRYERSDVIRSFSGTGNMPEVHVPYIKDGFLQEYIDGAWEYVGQRSPNAHWHHYDRGMKILNTTRNLQLKNNIYDSYTHEYLGDYLRFIRDFDRINLMPLYNCFSNVRSSNLDLKVKGSVFSASDPNYAIYSVPVRLFQKYTIALDCDQPIEYFCGFKSLTSDFSHLGMSEDPYSVLRTLFNQLSTQTYAKHGTVQFSHPILFTGLANLCPESLFAEAELQQPGAAAKLETTQYFLAQLALRERDLRLFIKVPSTLKSAVSILEGDFRGWNDISYKLQEVQDIFNDVPVHVLHRTFNTAAVSDEAVQQEADILMPTNLQLLQYNVGHSIPFADRLIEYLLGNCITGGDSELYGNLVLVKAALGKTGAAVWSPSYRKLFYRNLVANERAMANDKANHDLLGYVDKDVERYYRRKKLEQSMISIDIEEELNK